MELKSSIDADDAELMAIVDHNLKIIDDTQADPETPVLIYSLYGEDSDELSNEFPQLAELRTRFIEVLEELTESFPSHKQAESDLKEARDRRDLISAA